MPRDTKSILQQNKERSKKLNAPYDPLTGEGSLIDRKPVEVEPGVILYLPVKMCEEPLVKFIEQNGGLTEAAKKLKEEYNLLNRMFTDLRFKYDYEFWCATCVHITNDMGEVVPFILNPAQRQSLKERQAQRLNQKMVRQIELKHRQYGSTTEKNAYAFWIQNVVHDGYSAYICSLDSTGATKIVGRYRLIAENYPSDVKRIVMKPYMGLRNTFEIKSSRSRINIGTAQNPNAPSGDTTQVALISEAGKMKSTAEQGADKLLTNLMSMVPLRNDTYVLIESTAEISGKWFRNEVFKAMNGQSNFRLTFINWITETKLQRPIEDYPSFVENMREYDWFLWDQGASLEQINWYKQKEGDYQNDWQMKQEYPTTIEEAFQSTGSRVFAPNYVANLKKTCKDPLFIGDVIGDAEKGPEALQNLRFVPNPKGNLYIWAKPNDPEPDNHVANRYGGFADLAVGTSQSADYAVVSIFDRYWMTQGGMPERVCTWRGHLDQDLFAWKAVQIAKWYQNAFLAIEINSLKKKEDSSLTVLDEIKDYYYYLYARNSAQDVEKLEEGTPLKYGFFTNHATKRMIVNRLIAAARDSEYVERDIRACNELDYFEQKEDGTMGAIEGMHDDILITTAGGIWLIFDYMDAAFEEKPQEHRPQRYTEAML